MGKTLTVSQLNSYVKGVFDDELILQGITVTGEIFEFRTGGGNSYITLKEGDCVLNCVFFSSVATYEVGRQVALSGSVRFYPKSGRVSFIVSHIKILGRGELLLALEKTREQLKSEGVFSNNRHLPALVTNVAVVTSEDGAVLHDFFSIVGKLPYLRVKLFPVRVQGKGAADEICDIMSDIGRAFLRDCNGISGFLTANKECVDNEVCDIAADENARLDHGVSGAGNEVERFDVVVIARGGGSASDLSEFNNEALARAIHASAVPVISAVGHETDYTLSDFAADMRAGTPSIAAEMIVSNNARFFERLTESLNFIAAKTERLLEKRLRRTYDAASRIAGQITARNQNALGGVVYHVSKNQGFLEALLRKCSYRLKTETVEIAGRLTTKLRAAQSRLDVACARADELNPSKILRKGYAKISKNHKEISGVARLAGGDDVEIIMADGSALARVSSTKIKQD